MLDRQTYPDRRVVDLAQKVISVKINVGQDSAAADKFQIEGTPTIIFTRDRMGRPTMLASGTDTETLAFTDDGQLFSDTFNSFRAEASRTPCKTVFSDWPGRGGVKDRLTLHSMTLLRGLAATDVDLPDPVVDGHLA